MSPICSRGRGVGYVYVCYATRFSTNFCSICFIQKQSICNNGRQGFTKHLLAPFQASAAVPCFRGQTRHFGHGWTLQASPKNLWGPLCRNSRVAAGQQTLVMRGCSCKPSAKDTLCHRHMEDRDRPVPPMYAEIGRHRLKKALHSPGDVCFLEIEMSGYRGWIPANTVPEEALAKYFAEGASRNIEMRTVSSLIRCRCLLCSHFFNFPFKFFF